MRQIPMMLKPLGQRCLLAIAFAIVALSGLCAADAPGVVPTRSPTSPLEFSREADKGAFLQKVLSRVNEGGSSFCTRMLADLKTMHGVTFVEPIVRAPTFDSPALTQYREGCPLLQAGKIVEPGYEVDGESLQDRFGHALYLSANISLYFVDIDNDQSTGRDGKEYVLYGERVCAKFFADRCTGAVYRILDCDECTVETIESHADPYNYPLQKPTGAVSGILQYENENYLFSYLPHLRFLATQQGREFGTLRIHQYRAQSNEPSCVFDSSTQADGN